MTKGRVAMDRSRGSAQCKPQISPLRYASVEMTKGRVAMDRSRGSAQGKPQISPLRYASVEMTKGRVAMHRSRGSRTGQTADLSTPLRFGRDDKGEGCYAPQQRFSTGQTAD